MVDFAGSLIHNFYFQLSPIERYAMRFVEETGGSWTAEQLRAAEAEIEQQKREWEANRLATLKKAEEDAKRAAEEENEMLTYSREDAQNQVNNKSNKRRPINRRLLNAARKQENRKNIGRDRNRKRGEAKDIILVQTTTRPSLRSEAEGTRRILRNNIRSSSSASLVRRATENSSRKSSMSSEQSKSTKTSPSKRSTSLRLSRGPGRPSKRARHSEMAVSSGAEEETNGSAAEEIDENAMDNSANGNEKDSVLNSGDNVKSRRQSEVSEKPRSEELDDSECSLDVMIDSEEQDDSESQTRETSDRSEEESYDDEESTIVQTDDAYSISSQEDEDTNDEYSKENMSAMNSTVFESADNHIDTNTPRTTRSHGRLKINLFALDMSQILPELRAKRPSQMRRGRNTANASKNGNDDSDDEPTTLEDTNGLDVSVDSDSETSTRRNSRSTTRNNDLKNCDSTPPPPPNWNLRRAIRSSSAKQTPPAPGKNTKNISAPSEGDKSNHNNTLDKWITISQKTPKIILDKNECDKQQHMQNQKTCLTVNSKLQRRSDVSKR